MVIDAQEGFLQCLNQQGAFATMGTTGTQLHIRNSNLEFLDASGAALWSLPVHSIVLLAEYTTNEGPYVDDYFLVFVTAEDGKLYFSSSTFYAAGRDEALSRLQEQLGTRIRLELQGTAEWRSRVVWPSDMAGRQYFTFTPVPADTLLERLKKKLLGTTYEYTIAEDVRNYLREQLTIRFPQSPEPIRGEEQAT